MNLCIVSEFECTFDDFAAMVEKSRGEAEAFLADFELIKVHDHKSVMPVDCTDMEAFQAFMTTPEMQQWDEANGCVDTVYAMEQVN